MYNIELGSHAQLYHIGNEERSSKLQKKKRKKKRNGHFCMKKKQERADKYMLVSGALPIFAS